MKFPSFHLLLFAILCITICTSRSIESGLNSLLNSKSIACRGGYGGTYYMPPMTGGGGGGNSDSGTNGGGNAAGGAADGGTGAMSSIADMASTMMRTVQQTIGTAMDRMSNPMG